MKDWIVERSDAFTRDLDAIFDYIAETSRAFGSDVETAIETASQRVLMIEALLERLADAPFRGTRDDDVMLGLRHVTVTRAVYYFTVDNDEKLIRVLAVFYGGQDHRRHMLQWILANEG